MAKCSAERKSRRGGWWWWGGSIYVGDPKLSRGKFMQMLNSMSSVRWCCTWLACLCKLFPFRWRCLHKLSITPWTKSNVILFYSFMLTQRSGPITVANENCDYTVMVKILKNMEPLLCYYKTGTFNIVWLRVGPLTSNVTNLIFLFLCAISYIRN